MNNFERINLGIPKDQMIWLREEKQRRGLSVQVLIRLALEEYIKKQQTVYYKSIAPEGFDPHE